MKYHIIRLGSLFTLIGFLFLQCKKDERDINLTVTEVKSFFAPADGKSVKLQPAANLVETFEWDQAMAEDGSLVLYTVAFDQENGDFSQPFYTTVSDNKGVVNKLTITHGDLNKIASLGGADFFQKKKFRWTVFSSKGTNSRKATQARVIELERPGGFAVLPGTLYLTGTATEGGATPANALKMKQLSPGVFEIFSKLTAGNYQFVDAISGTPKQYYMFVDNGVNSIGMNGQTAYSGTSKIMRIKVDFNNINVSYTEVKSVSFWYCQGNTTWFDLPYVSNGQWRKNGYAVTLATVPWGLEERYKYKMVVNDGTGDKDQWLNSNFNDPPGQDNAYPSTETYRTINMSVNNSSQFDWGWKLDRVYLQQGTVTDFWVSLRGSDANYTQNYQKQ
jgi:hypothetical protein